jgi:hypothetical protein
LLIPRCAIIIFRGYSATKPKLNPSSEYPYTLLKAVYIDDLATKQIQTHCNTLDSHGLKLLMAPEIEVFFENFDYRDKTLESKDNAIRLSDNSQNEDYKFSYIFPPPGDDNKSGRQTLLERFRSSGRAKEIFGDELHARICKADFTD